MSDPIERRKNDPWRADITQRMQAMESGHQEMKVTLNKNTEMTADVHAKTSEIVEFFGAAKGAFTVLGWLGKIAKWVTAIAAAAGVVWALLKTGLFPQK